MDIPVVDIKGNNVGSVSIQIDIKDKEYNISHISYLLKKQQEAALRSGTHSTKTRGEVSGGGSKPYKQKGTGKARRGSSRTPLRVGGGISFGPKPRKYSVRVNKQVVKIGYRLITNANKEKLRVLEVKGSDAIKTKEFQSFIEALGAPQAKRVVLVSTSSPEDSKVQLAARNIRSVSCYEPTFVPAFEYANSDLVVFTPSAIQIVEERFLK